MGAMIIVSSITEKQWLGIAFGGYFASMGVFGYGCAAGNCGVPGYRASRYRQEPDAEVEYEEVKE